MLSAALRDLARQVADDVRAVSSAAGYHLATERAAERLALASTHETIVSAIVDATRAVATVRATADAVASQGHTDAQRLDAVASRPAAHGAVESARKAIEPALVAAEVALTVLAQAHTIGVLEAQARLEAVAAARPDLARMESLRSRALAACGVVAWTKELIEVPVLLAAGPVAWLRAIRAVENAVAHAERREECEPNPLHTREQFEAARAALSELRDAVEGAADVAFRATLNTPSQPPAARLAHAEAS